MTSSRSVTRSPTRRVSSRCRSTAGPGPATGPARDLYAPAGAQDFFRRVVGCWGDEELIEKAFALEEYEAGDELALGPLTVRFCEVPHYTLTHAVEIRAAGGQRLTFSADCSPNHQLPSFARDTDMLLIEATLPRPERTGERGHLTPREAGGARSARTGAPARAHALLG